MSTCHLPHHPRKRTSCVLVGQTEERDGSCSVPRVTEILHFGVDTFNQMKLSFQSPQGLSKDEEWSSGSKEKTMEILNRNSLLKNRVLF